MSTTRGGKERVNWRWGGTRAGKPESATFDTKEDAELAQKILAEYERRLTRAELYALMLGDEVEPAEEEQSATPTYGAMFKPFILSRPRRAASTNESYRSHFRCEIEEAFGSKRVDKITQNDVAKFIRHLDKVKRTSSTVTRYYATLHASLEYAVRQGYIVRNPANSDHLGFDRDQDRSFDVIDPALNRRMYLTHGEFELLAQNASPYSRPLIELLAGSGLRISEAVALDIQDMDFVNKTVRVFKQVEKVDDDEDDNNVKPLSGVPGYKALKGRRNRLIVLEDDVLEWVKQAIGDRKPGSSPGDAPIFLSPEGEQWDYDNFLKRSWYPAVAAASRCSEHPPPLPPKPRRGPRRNWRIDEISTCDCATRLRRRPTPHQLRHSHATWLVDAGWTMPQISRRLGHSSVKVTDETYADYTQDKQSAQVDSLNIIRRQARAEGVTARKET